MHDEAFHRFAELLDDRFSKGRFTTEDSVRYALFHCLIGHLNVDPSDIILEFPHPSIVHACMPKADTVRFFLASRM